MEPNKPQQSSKEFTGFKEEDLIELIENLKKEGIDMEKVTNTDIRLNTNDIIVNFSRSDAFNDFLVKKSKDKFNNTIYQANYVPNKIKVEIGEFLDHDEIAYSSAPYREKLANELPESEGIKLLNIKSFHDNEINSETFFHSTPAILKNTIKTDASGLSDIERKITLLREDLLPDAKELDDTIGNAVKPIHTSGKIQGDGFSCNTIALNTLMHISPEGQQWYSERDKKFLPLPQELRYSQSMKYTKATLAEWQEKIDDILARTKSKDTATKEKAQQELKELEKVMLFLNEKKIREDIKKYPVKINPKKIQMIKDSASQDKVVNNTKTKGNEEDYLPDMMANVVIENNTKNKKKNNNPNIVTINGTEFMTIKGYVDLKKENSYTRTTIVSKTVKLLTSLVTLIEKRKQQKR